MVMQFRKGEVVRSSEPAANSGADGVEANARLTSSVAALLLVLLAAEGLTLPALHTLLRPHVFIGFALIPPVALKIGSTLYRFARYYTHSAAYRQKGAPLTLLRMLGPVVVLATLLLLTSGVGLLFLNGAWQNTMLTLHEVSFVLWFAAMTVHVLGHLVETARLGARDWIPRTHDPLPMAAGRRWLVATSVLAGALLGAWGLGHVGGWAFRA
jgi:hypothetical protein